jgi:hypothetical protein
VHLERLEVYVRHRRAHQDRRLDLERIGRGEVLARAEQQERA